MNGPPYMDPHEVRGRVFVGRDEELRVLAAEFAEAAAGHGRLVSVTGDAGSGKTRVVEEFVARAPIPSGRVVWGPCPEQPGAPPYWPWVQAIRAYTDSHDPTTLGAELGAGGPAVAPLVPALRQELPDRGLAAPVESEAWRFQIFDGLAGFLRRATERLPLVIVLDDLHWADPASVQLLGFLARELRGARLMVLSTYRTAEMDARHGLIENLARANRRIHLRGLGREEIRRVMHLTTGITPAPGLVADVHRITEENPFFVGEFVRMLEADGGLESNDLASLPIKLPAELRATIRRRLAPLGTDERRMLDVAAVIGRDFDTVMLQAASELSRERVLERIAPALAAHV